MRTATLVRTLGLLPLAAIAASAGAQPTFFVSKETTLYRFQVGGGMETFTLSDRIRGMGTRSNHTIFAVSPVLPDEGEPEFYQILNPFGANPVLTPTDVQTSFGWSSVTEVGDLLYAIGGQNNLFVIDPADDYEPTLIGPTGLSDVGGLSYDPDSGLLYALDNDTDGLYTLDFGTGAAGPLIGTLGVNSDSCGLEFFDGVLYAVIQNVTHDRFQLGTIDTASGAFSPIMDVLGFAERSATGLAVIPAPGGAALLAVASLVLVRRRRA